MFTEGSFTNLEDRDRRLLGVLAMLLTVAVGCGDSADQVAAKGRDEYQRALETYESELSVLRRIEDELASATAEHDRIVAEASDLVGQSGEFRGLQQVVWSHAEVERLVQKLVADGVPVEDARKKIQDEADKKTKEVEELIAKAETRLQQAKADREEEIQMIENSLADQRALVMKAKERRDALQPIE